MEPSADALIAIVEDDDEIRRLVIGLLAREGYQIAEAQNGVDLDAILAGNIPDLIILDLMLPGEDGLSICRRLRSHGGAVPILMLTAKSDAIDRVVGLEMGADDYLTKPFNPRELVARVRALLRRVRGMGEAAPSSRRYAFEGLVIDLDAPRSLLQPELVQHQQDVVIEDVPAHVQAQTVALANPAITGPFPPFTGTTFSLSWFST